MISSTARPAISRMILLFVVLLALPALLRGDQKPDDKKPATKAPPAPAAPKTAAGGQMPGRPAQTPAAGARGALPGSRPANTRPATAAVSKAAGPPLPGRKPTQTVQLPGGPAAVSRRANGAVATIHAPGMTINHTLRGPRTVVKESNGRRIVAVGRAGGYVQRPYLVRNGRTYVQRTYVVGGVSRVAVYRSYSYGGAVYYGYAPAYYYRPAYYGWAYEPWGAPVAYGPAAWGWAGSPWYGAYGAYFAPYPAYASASQWLTDYLLAANLQAAYAAGAHADAGAVGGASAPAAAEAAGAQTPLSPQVKQMIAEEVKSQLAASKAAAVAQGVAPSAEQLPEALNPAERIFVVSSHLDVPSTSGEECGLAPGDVVMRMTDAPDANRKVSASVQSSQKADCAAGKTVSIGVEDLQEMHNQFRQHLDSGLQTLAGSAGKDGLPQAPDATTVGGEVPAPAPDKSAAEQLDNAQQEAEAVDNAVQHGSNGI